MSFASKAREVYDYGWRPPTTMVDLLFLLLIFFITIAAFRDEEREIDVTLQPAESFTSAGTRTPIIVTVTADNQLFIGQRQFQPDELRETLKALALQFGDEPVVIRGDKLSELGAAVQVLDMARAAGLTNVSIATSKPK